jgi:hypothetical protein
MYLKALVFPFRTFEELIFVLNRRRANKALHAPLMHDLSSVLSPAVDSIENAVQSTLCGVFVHWGPVSSGKTVAMKDMTLRMRSQGFPVKYLDAHDRMLMVQDNFFFIDWLRSGLGLSLEGNAIDLDLILPKSKAGPTIIVIDHFDDLMETFDPKFVIKALCRFALEKKTYKIVLVIARVNRALEVLNWHGGDKIRIAGSPGCGRWDFDGISLVAASEPRLMSYSDEDRKKIIRLGTLSGSPSIFHDMVISGPNEAKARMGHDQYADGTEKLNEFLRSRGW